MVRAIVLGLSALAGLALASTAEAKPFWQRAHGFQLGHHHHCQFKVLYRDCHCQSWSCYGTYHDSCCAERVACGLRHQGLEARVVSF
jgi:hypothetical protein